MLDRGFTTSRSGETGENAEEEISVEKEGGGRRRAYRSESDVPMISRRDVVDSGEFFLIHPMPRAVQRRGFKRLVSVRIPR